MSNNILDRIVDSPRGRLCLMTGTTIGLFFMSYMSDTRPVRIFICIMAILSGIGFMVTRPDLAH